MLFVLSAPSGSGKTTIARRILPMFEALSFSVSATTRPRRPNEREGADYYFLTADEFQSRIDGGLFVEWEEVFGNRYGTPVSEVERADREGRHLLFDVDVKGALSIKAAFGDAAVLIFIEPPDLETLRRRLEHRGSESPEVIERRIARAKWEMEQAPRFDYRVVNDDLSRSVPAVAAIVAERSGMPARQQGRSS
ncbi:MAG: guanylate kinase [Ignavibacteriae bacterium]|nr:guanylate kinase [Ignavibacteriota bacterium]